jgi:tetratricopeptide (TPR) repeat protein
MAEESGYIPGETRAGARATPELVGRIDELEQIESAIRDTETSYVIYITGRGGIGKTRLIQHVLEHPPEDIELVVASRLIDLYHTRVHSLAGLIDAILKVVEPLGNFFRSELKKAGEDKLEALARAEREGLSTAEVISLRKELTEFFLQVLNRFTEQNRLVLALDTAERLLIERDPAQQILDLTGERPVILDWLLDRFLPRVRNSIVLLAGRPGPGNLEQDLAQMSSKQVLPITLRGLTEEVSLEYFESVIHATEASDEPRDLYVAESLRLLSEEDRRTVFHCLRDEGDPPTIRPILLALAIDYLIVEGEPLPDLTQPLDEARALSPDQRQNIRNNLGEELAQTIHENRRPADKLIDALGWLRKGGDVDLLARIANLNHQEVEDSIGKIEDLSFVKIRPDDERVFLHDEMYDLLGRYALDEVRGQGRERVFETLQEYYKEHVEQARDEIAELYRPLAEDALPEANRVIAARVRLQDALVEDLYYRLRWDATEGFQTYFRYAEEAIAANDESLDMQLRAELLSFLAERDPSGEDDIIDGLNRSDVVADAAVRWIKRLINDGRNDRALDVAQSLRSDGKGLIEAGGVLAKAELNTWEALALTYNGIYDQARELLSRAEKELAQSQIPGGQLIRLSAVLARVYNNLGYLRRVQGQFVGAAEAYRRALPHWRYVKIEAEQANTLTNFAFALALCGRFAEARRHALDALNLREHLGPRAPVVLSCNTLAEIETRAGHYYEARPYAQRALALSQALEFRRGKILALLGIAALHRFMSEAPDLSTEEKVKFLEQALSESQSALNTLSVTEREPEREIRAYYERGVTFREISQASHSGEVEDYIVKAEKDLEKARNLARQEDLWLSYLDSSLGLAWTYYYAKETENLSNILQELETEVQEHFSDYHISRGFPQIEEDTLVGVFNQLARLHVLKGVQAMDAFEQSKKQLPHLELKEAAREFMLALEYDVLVAEDHQGIRRALNTIHARLKELNTRELTDFYEFVAAAAAQEQDLTKEECRLWRELEETFGPYEIFSRLAQ